MCTCTNMWCVVLRAAMRGLDFTAPLSDRFGRAVAKSSLVMRVPRCTNKRHTGFAGAKAGFRWAWRCTACTAPWDAPFAPCRCPSTANCSKYIHSSRSPSVASEKTKSRPSAINFPCFVQLLTCNTKQYWRRDDVATPEMGNVTRASSNVTLVDVDASGTAPPYQNEQGLGASRQHDFSTSCCDFSMSALLACFSCCTCPV